MAESLFALAPLHFANQRQERYAGDDLCVASNRLAERDQMLVRALYQRPGALLRAIVDTSTGEPRKRREVALWSERNNSLADNDLPASFDELHRPPAKSGRTLNSDRRKIAAPRKRADRRRLSAAGPPQGIQLV